MMVPLPFPLRYDTLLFFPFRMRAGLFPMLMVLFCPPPLALGLLSPAASISRPSTRLIFLAWPSGRRTPAA
jgi:hypothetical protein